MLIGLFTQDFMICHYQHHPCKSFMICHYQHHPCKSLVIGYVKTALMNQSFPRHGYPEVIIHDCGMEFNEKNLSYLLKNFGIQCRKTTPYHPETNGKVERFNRTLKEMLARLMNNEEREWENKLAVALTAYRNSTSTVTGYTPFFLMFGRRNRLPLIKSFAGARGNNFPQRLYDVTKALAISRTLTEQSRKYNRARINACANAGQIQVGDTVLLKAHEPLTLTSKFDPEYTVTNVVGDVCWIVHQPSGRKKIVNRPEVLLGSSSRN